MAVLDFARRCADGGHVEAQPHASEDDAEHPLAAGKLRGLGGGEVRGARHRMTGFLRTATTILSE